MMLRGGGSFDWNRDWDLPKGIRGTTTASTLVDLYRVWDNPDIPDAYETQIVPAAAVELRWPFVKSTGGARHVIEPIGQVVWSQAIHDQQNIPNEDSRLPEFDETNLFSLNRFPGLDRAETGLRANLGISYTRYDPAGWSLGLTLGRVVRDTEIDDFAEGTGLAGRWSDYIGSVSLELPWGLGLVNRALFDPDLVFRRNEFALAYDGDLGALRAAYTYLAEDDSNPILGPAARDERARPRRQGPRPPQLGAARPLALRPGGERQPAGRGGDNLRQRVRGVRPFGLAPLYHIV